MSKFYDFEAEDVMCNMHKMEEYQEQGFEILDFPCNQFGNQAPGTNEEIVSFCDAKFGITFKHYAKIDVNGADIKFYNVVKTTEILLPIAYSKDTKKGNYI